MKVRAKDGNGNESEWSNALSVSIAGMPEERRGDVNNDGAIDVLDVLAVVRHVLERDPLVGDALDRADCDGNGDIDVLDVLGIVNVILGISECVPEASGVKRTPEIMKILDIR
ncbi:MAG: dockerin type I repeat-containing protein [Gemmatimonadota bacterium]|nr:MAG: dockerin type I repeat-containing protein [Gemmatimonadota bacterium]